MNKKINQKLKNVKTNLEEEKNMTENVITETEETTANGIEMEAESMGTKFMKGLKKVGGHLLSFGGGMIAGYALAGGSSCECELDYEDEDYKEVESEDEE